MAYATVPSTLSALVLAAVAAVAPGCLYDPELPGSNEDSSGGDEDSSGGDEDSSGGDEDSSGGGDESGGDDSSGGDEGPAPSPEPDPMPEPDPAPDPGPEPDPEPDCEPSDEICNGFDDDCDGEIDEPCPADGAAIVLANDLLGVQYALGATEYPGTPSMLETQVDGNMVLVSPQQVWTVHHLGDGWMRLVNEALGEAYSLDSSPVEPVIGPTGDYTGQAWTATEDDSGCVRLFNQFLGPDQWLATDSDTFDLLMAETGPSAGQCWQLVPLQ